MAALTINKTQPLARVNYSLWSINILQLQYFGALNIFVHVIKIN